MSLNQIIDQQSSKTNNQTISNTSSTNNSYNFETKENNLYLSENSGQQSSNTNNQTTSNISSNISSTNNSYNFQTKENNNIKSVINLENKNFENNSETKYENGFVKNYSYSNKSGSTINNINNENYYSLNNVIKNSLEIEKPTQNMTDGVFTKDEITNQRNLYETNNYQNIQTIKNTSFYDNIESETRNFKLEKEKQKDMAERTAIQMSRNKKSKESEDDEQTQEMNESIRDNRSAPSTSIQPGNYDSPAYNHINTPNINDINNILTKMNSPPVWRTVLG